MTDIRTAPCRYFDMTPVWVTGEIIARRAGISAVLSQHDLGHSLGIWQGCRVEDRDTLLRGPLFVPVTLQLPRHLAALHGFDFEEVAP